jgi:quercetin dioxygenase-like cupin family protein
MDEYYTGNLRDDALKGKHGGWVVGVYLDDLKRRTQQIEVKYWEYPKGQATGHDTKTSTNTEWTYILEGKTRARVGDDELILRAGEHILIHPGTINNLVTEILEDIKGITVKSPSDPNAKKIITTQENA